MKIGLLIQLVVLNTAYNSIMYKANISANDVDSENLNALNLDSKTAPNVIHETKKAVDEALFSYFHYSTADDDYQELDDGEVAKPHGHIMVVNALTEKVKQAQDLTTIQSAIADFNANHAIAPITISMVCEPLRIA